MSDFIDSLNFENERFSTAAAAFAPPKEVFIELGDSKKKANVVRDRFQIPAVEIDKDRFDDFVIAQPRVVNKVVSQSIAPGTVVSEGASIDLVMAPARNVPGNIFTDGHSGLKDRLLSEVFEQFVSANNEVKGLLAKRPDIADLTNEDVQFIAQIAEENDVEIEAGTPGKTPQDLFATWQIANTFSG